MRSSISEARDAAAASPRESPLTVLIVDDHPPFAEGLSALLEKQADMTPVGVACDGEEAIHKARDLRPDVVVMDISMPKLGGIEATRTIKAEFPNTAVLALSAHGYYPYVISALDAGAGGYLLKTVPLRELVSAVRALRAGEAVLEQSVAEKLLSTVAGSLRGESSADYLTNRELEVLKLSARGISNREIGGKMGVAERTVQAYFTNIFDKLGVGSRIEAVLQAVKQGWISLDDLP